MTKTELKKTMAQVIDSVIFGMARETGRFTQGVNLCRISDHATQLIPIDTVSDLPSVGAAVRRERPRFQADFSIIASNTMIGIKNGPVEHPPEVKLGLEGIERVFEDPSIRPQPAYLFLGYAPEAGHVLAVQQYKRDSDGVVSLSGKLKFFSTQKAASIIEAVVKMLAIVDPWRELSPEDQKVLEDVDIRTVDLRGGAKPASTGRLTFEKLFPKPNGATAP